MSTNWRLRCIGFLSGLGVGVPMLLGVRAADYIVLIVCLLGLVSLGFRRLERRSRTIVIVCSSTEEAEHISREIESKTNWGRG